MWHATLTKAIAWMSGFMLADGPTCQKEVFGHLQVQGSQLAHAHYLDLQTEIDAVNCRVWNSNVAHLDPVPPKPPTPPVARAKSIAAASSHVDIAIAPVAVPPPPPAARTKRPIVVPPPQASKAKRPMPPAGPPTAKAYQEAEERNEVEGEAVLPSWATFEPNVTVWWEFMDKLHPPVDREARQALFNLAQDDYHAANGIIAVMLKKVADGHWMNNPSGFIHSSVLNARFGPPQH